MNLKKIRKELNKLNVRIDDGSRDTDAVVIWLFDIVNDLVKELEKERGNYERQHNHQKTARP